MKIQVHALALPSGSDAPVPPVPAPGSHAGLPPEIPERTLLVAWCRTSPDPAARAATEAVLSPSERERADRFRVASARAEFVTGRWLVRSLLGRWLGQPAAAVALRVDERGRPGSGTAGTPDFSLAHAAGCVAAAFVREGRIGIDVEPESSGTHALELADQVFSPVERRDFDLLPTVEQHRRFVATWTTKEAVLKALGTGLLVDPREVELVWENDGHARLATLRGTVVAPSVWELDVWTGPRGFRGALAWTRRGF